MEKIVSLLTVVPKGRIRKDDDVVDRLSHQYTTLILVVFAVVVSGRIYLGRPITCWVPKHFTGSHTKFTNSYCWVKNTYYLPYEEDIPKEHEDEKRHDIIYYQWLPFILLGQAVFFFLPCLIWRSLNQKAGVDCDNILESAGSYERTQDSQKRDRTLKLIVNQMDRFLTSRKSDSQGEITSQVRESVRKLICGGRRFNNYLAILYLFVKVLYIGNVLGQLFVLNSVLSTNFNVYGIEVINNVIQDKHLVNSASFPRVTMCDFKIRVLGNVQRYTVQCVLPINLYTEKMYAFLWFWMVFVGFMTCVSLVTWFLRFVMDVDKVRYIRAHLRFMDKLGDDVDEERTIVNQFVKSYLYQDGVFMLRMIGHNTNTITVTEVIEALFDHWKTKRAKKTPYEGLLDEFPSKDV